MIVQLIAIEHVTRNICGAVDGHEIWRQDGLTPCLLQFSWIKNLAIVTKGHTLRYECCYSRQRSWFVRPLLCSRRHAIAASLLGSFDFPSLDPEGRFGDQKVACSLMIMCSTPTLVRDPQVWLRTSPISDRWPSSVCSRATTRTRMGWRCDICLCSPRASDLWLSLGIPVVFFRWVCADESSVLYRAGLWTQRDSQAHSLSSLWESVAGHMELTDYYITGPFLLHYKKLSMLVYGKRSNPRRLSQGSWHSAVSRCASRQL